MAKRTQSIKASFTERLAMHDLMKEHLFEEGAGLWRYRDGWSDERVAKEASESVGTDHSAGLNSEHAAYVRREVFGNLVNTNPAAPVSRAAHADHELRITRLENQIRRLMDALGMNAQEKANVIGNGDHDGGA